MKNNRMFQVFSLFFIPLVMSVVYADIAGVFSYTDFPFVLAFSFYLLFCFIQKSTYRMTFAMALFFLLWMGLSYIPTGTGEVTERIGEWLYLFFVFGLVQYIKEQRYFQQK